jgi:hypothetical protein
MIYEETLEKYNDSVKDAVDELFSNSFTNQRNDTDLLLVFQNALKNNHPEETLKRLNITNFQIGPDFIGFRYNSFYKFINAYRDKVFKKTDQKAELEKDPFERDYIYHNLIEQELLIYLKFWESDLILRRLYNLTRLARGEEYEWIYDQSFFNARRKLVKEEIQKDLDRISPKFNALIEEIYSRQIRNAIAHSQYYLLYDSINLTNKDENPHYILGSISYDDWEILFHKTILFYNYLISNTNEYSEKYQKDVKGKHYGLMIVFPEKDSKGNNKTGWLKFDESFNRWYWNNG